MQRRALGSVLLLASALAACGGARDGSAGAPLRERIVPPGKVFLVGLDGADWEIIDRLEGEGRLPNLARLRAQGAWGVLRSEEPLLSPIVWTSIATGRGPLEHGIFGFLTVRDGVREPVRSDERRVRAFWEIAGEYGLEVGVVGWYASWPAEPVRGFMVSDRIGTHQVRGEAARATTGLVSPPELLPEIEEIQGQVERETGRDAASRFFTSGGAPRGAFVSIEQERLDTFVGVLRTTELYRRLVPELVERYRPDLFAVYFEGTDAVGHLFAEYADPPLPGVDREIARYLAPAFDRYYEYVDRILGEFLDLVDPATTTLIVLSDHGFKTGDRRLSVASSANAAEHAPVWHRPEGVILLWGRGVRQGVRLPESGVYDVLPTVFRLLDVPLAETLAGRFVEAALDPELNARPIATLGDYESIGERAVADAAAELPGDETLAKLRALGYIGSAEPSRGGAASAGAAPSGQQAITLNRYNEAIVLAEAGRWREALDLFRALQADDADSPLGYLGEGQAHLARFAPADAVAPLERAAGMAPDLPGPHALLGEAYLGAGRVAEARRALEHSLRIEPHQGRASLLLAGILLGQGDAARARALLETALQLCERPRELADACVGLAVVAEESRRFDEAAARYRAALEHLPDYPRALERWANLELFLDRPERAVDLLSRLVRGVPDNPAALNLYARALLAAGRADEARAALERSLQLAPDQPPVRESLREIGRRAS